MALPFTKDEPKPKNTLAEILGFQSALGTTLGADRHRGYDVSAPEPPSVSDIRQQAQARLVDMLWERGTRPQLPGRQERKLFKQERRQARALMDILDLTAGMDQQGPQFTKFDAGDVEAFMTPSGHVIQPDPVWAPKPVALAGEGTQPLDPITGLPIGEQVPALPGKPRSKFQTVKLEGGVGVLNTETGELETVPFGKGGRNIKIQGNVVWDADTGEVIQDLRDDKTAAGFFRDAWKERHGGIFPKPMTDEEFNDLIARSRQASEQFRATQNEPQPGPESEAIARIQKRIQELRAEGKSDEEIQATLLKEGY